LIEKTKPDRNDQKSSCSGTESGEKTFASDPLSKRMARLSEQDALAPADMPGSRHLLSRVIRTGG
jgi:hypothetical protein